MFKCSKVDNTISKFINVQINFLINQWCENV